MALTKVTRTLLNTGIADSSDATAITINSSENVTLAGTLDVTGVTTLLSTLGVTGAITWASGGSANANTAYTYSQVGHLPLAGGAITGAITTNSTFDGRDVATDGTKLDGIEVSADVTDTTNVTAAGALMDSELAGIAAVKATTGTFLTADQTKLDAKRSK